MAETVLMTLEELKAFHNETVKIAAKEAAKTVFKETSKESVRKSEIRSIRNKLAAYRRHKKTIEEDIDFTPVEKFEYRLQFLEDLMGVRTIDSSRTEEMILAREEKRRVIGYELLILEHAVEKFKEEVELSEDKERTRWFNVMYDFYIGNESITMEEVADNYGISRATAWRDLDKACGVVLEYLV